MLARRLGMLLAGAAVLGFASMAGALTTDETVWTHLKDELDGTDLYFYGHDLNQINYEWASTADDLSEISGKVWKMKTKVCFGGNCDTSWAHIWIKSGAPGRYHAFYQLDGESWRRARPVPEPTSAAVFALGLGVVATRLRRGRK